MRQNRRIPSNRMPAVVPEPLGFTGWIVLVAIAMGFIYLCMEIPAFIAGIMIVVIVSWILGLVENRRREHISAERQGESICSFARSFDCRATDPWIVRAVYEEVTEYAIFPVRPDDRLEADLEIDSEDIGDIAEVIAQRTGRLLEECDSNPLHGKVTTVREMVEFFTYQPRRT